MYPPDGKHDGFDEPGKEYGEPEHDDSPGSGKSKAEGMKWPPPKSPSHKDEKQGEDSTSEEKREIFSVAGHFVLYKRGILCEVAQIITPEGKPVEVQSSFLINYQ